MSNKTSDKNVVNIEELIQEYKTYNDLDGIQDLSIYVNALENLLSEREQKDKRIKELEADLYSANEIISDLIDNIPKQVVIDLIENETINISGFECIAVEDLQELLEGRNENG